MIFCGIDLSYTSPGVCVYDTALPAVFENLKFFGLKEDSTKKAKDYTGQFGNVNMYLQPKWSCAEERYYINSRWLHNILVTHDVQAVALEGYALGARAGLTFNIAENTSLVKQSMFHLGIPFETPSPGTVKKNFTGKGNAKKEQMIDRFYELFPHADLCKQLGVKDKYSKPIDDIVDSFANLCAHTEMKGVFL